MLIPKARFFPVAEGVILHGKSSYVTHSEVLTTSTLGGYFKDYIKGKRPVGVALEDTWFLKYVGRPLSTK